MPSVVLVGAPGSGKSTVGRLVAAELGTAFLDTDDVVEAEAGMSVHDVFVVQGEESFRALERAAVLAGLARHDGVLALGGGAVLAADVRTALAGRPVVWLQVGTDAAVSRLGMSGPRPVLLGNVRGQWSQLLAARAPLYEQVARWTIDTARLDPAAVAGRIVEILRGTDG